MPRPKKEQAMEEVAQTETMVTKETVPSAGLTRKCSYNPMEHLVLSNGSHGPEMILTTKEKITWFNTWCQENGVKGVIDDSEYSFYETKVPIQGYLLFFTARCTIYMDGEIAAKSEATGPILVNSLPDYVNGMKTLATNAKGRALSNCGFNAGGTPAGEEETTPVPYPQQNEAQNAAAAPFVPQANPMEDPAFGALPYQHSAVPVQNAAPVQNPAPQPDVVSGNSVVANMTAAENQVPVESNLSNGAQPAMMAPAEVPAETVIPQQKPVKQETPRPSEPIQPVNDAKEPIPPAMKKTTNAETPSTILPTEGNPFHSLDEARAYRIPSGEHRGQTIEEMRTSDPSLFNLCLSGKMKAQSWRPAVYAAQMIAAAENA